MSYNMKRNPSDIVPAVSLKVFDEPHAADMILFIHSNPGCYKTDVYKSVARGTRMGDKLDILQDNGILRIENGSRSSSLTLTAKGESVALHLLSISEILAREAA